MGYRFNLQHINWLSALLDPYRAPTISDVPQLREAIHDLRSGNRAAFMSSRRFERMFAHEMEFLLHRMEVLPLEDVDDLDLRARRELELRWRDDWIHWRDFHLDFFQRPWTACIVPSGNDFELDNRLCSPGLLRELVDDRPEHPGLILQPSESPGNHLTLLDAIPAFRHALNNVDRWPLLLVWSNEDAALLPLGRNPDAVLDRLRLGIRLLYEDIPLDCVESEYDERIGRRRSSETEPVHLIHLSDVHIGSKEASTRTRHLSHLVRTLRSELGNRTIPVISGDLFDTPDPSLRGQVMDFVDEVGRAVGDRPFCVLGNHDVRHGGWGASDPGAIMEAHLLEPIRVYEHFGVSLVGFNSCEGGDLARGEITEAQLHDRNQRIDEQAVGLRIGVVHHHPITVDHPDWELRPFWQRWLDPIHGPTVEMVNGTDLLQFCDTKGMRTVLHGHKHIPRFTSCENVRVVGCGSSVGIIKTKDRKPYISVNVLTVFPDTGRVITRLLADRTHGGLAEQTRHEFVSLS